MSWLGSRLGLGATVRVMVRGEGDLRGSRVRVRLRGEG